MLQKNDSHAFVKLGVQFHDSLPACCYNQRFITLPCVHYFMKYRISTLFFLIFVMSGYTGVCVAADPIDEQRALAGFILKPPIFNFLDCENDGTIEKGEVDEHFPQVFFIYDKDRSRDLSRSEYVSSTHPEDKALQARIFKLMDSNGDNLVSTTEYRLYFYQIIDSADINSDGEVSLQELAQLQSPSAQAISENDNINAKP